jgi:uncharacterized membrane protein
MKNLIKSSLIFFLLDGIFIYLMKDKFNNQIIKIQGSPMKPDILASILTYIFLLLALNYFILNQNKKPTDAFILGLCIYGIYEFTSKALLKDWPLDTAIIDTLWGGILFGSTTYLFNKF